MRSLSKQTGTAHVHSLFWKQCIKSIILLLSVVPMLVVASEIFAAGQKKYPEISSAHSPGITNQMCRDEILYKKTLSIYNMGSDSMYRILAGEDMNQLEKLTIYNTCLNTVRFLEGLKLPLLKYLKITDGNSQHSRNNPLQTARIDNIQPYINSLINLDRLEIDTKKVFEGMHSLVERTKDLLVMPLCLFATMHEICSVSLKATSIKFTYVTIGALDLVEARTNKYAQRNTSIKIITFAASVSLGSHISHTTGSFISKIIVWMREIFGGIRCINLEEKGFVEPKHLRRVVVTGFTLIYVPHLSIICINDMVLYIRIRNAAESLGYLSGREMFKKRMLYDVVRIYATWNAECLELVSFEKIKKYVNRKQLIPYQSFTDFAFWYDANKKETIVGELEYSLTEFNRYYA